MFVYKYANSDCVGSVLFICTLNADFADFSDQRISLCKGRVRHFIWRVFFQIILFSHVAAKENYIEGLLRLLILKYSLKDKIYKILQYM